jgi:hypothetical protein
MPDSNINIIIHRSGEHGGGAVLVTPYDDDDDDDYCLWKEGI